jgi:hypothetical protein
MNERHTETQGERTGGCLCGAVRFTAKPHGNEIGACHCGMCRRWSAGPFLAVECSADVAFAGDAPLGVYRSSEWAERGFCSRCGTILFYRLVDKPFYAISAEAFDDRSNFKLASQIFIDEKPAYYTFADKTKDMTGAEVFAAFAPPAADGAAGGPA